MEIQHFISHNQAHKLRRLAESGWEKSQANCAGIFRSVYCEAGLVMLVIVSFVIVIMEADYKEAVPSWLKTTNLVLTWVYAVEMTVRLFIYRQWFFTMPVNVFDLVVVMVEITTHFLSTTALVSDMPSVAPLRLIRLLRLARGYKILVKFPQLGLMVKGLISGASAALYGVGLLLIILAIWGIFAVHFIHPINERVSLTGIYDGCVRCPHAFADVRSSMLTFFQQIIAGDSWGSVTMPIIEDSPQTVVFFGLVFISVQFTMMNVILAVIVDSALKASQEDIEDILKKKEESVDAAQTFLLEICREMDRDNSGDLTEMEIFTGYDEHQEFRDILNSMDIKREDMKIVFKILDADGSGSVDYNEFIGELFKMKQHDSHTLLIFIKHYAKEIRRDVAHQLHLFRDRLGTTGSGSAETFFLTEEKPMPPRHEEKQRELGIGSRYRGGIVQSSVSEPVKCQRRLAFADCGESTPRPQLVEARNLREQLGEELHHLKAVVSEDLLARVQEITRKLEGQEDQHELWVGKSPSGRRGLPTSRVPKAPSLRPSFMEAATAPTPGSVAGGRLDLEGDCCGELDLPLDSVQWSPRPSEVSLPASIWGMKARCDDENPAPGRGLFPVGRWQRFGQQVGWIASA